MTLNRHNPRRDDNEPVMVELARKAGRVVTRLNGKGVTDLLVVKPSRDLPIYIVRTIEHMQDVLAADDDIALVEVKGAKGRLTDDQLHWHMDNLGLVHPDELREVGAL